MDERIPMNRTPMDSAVYETIRTASNVAHRCALCNEVLSTSAAPGPFLMDQLINAHHAVCPARPLAVGDFVRWSRTTRDLWIEGELVEASEDGSNIHLRVTAQGGDWPTSFDVGAVQRCDGSKWKSVALRRIPRPAAAPAFSLVTTGSGALAVRTAHGDIKITDDPTLKPDEVRVEQRRVYRPVVVDKSAMERAERDEKLMQRLQEETDKRLQWLQTSGTKSYTLAGPVLGQQRTIRVAHDDMPVGTLGPALIDGLTREQCSTRWLENRLAVEGGASPPNVLTRMQRDVGRAMWLAGPGAKRSAELRDRVAADREAERNRVRVEVQDVD